MEHLNWIKENKKVDGEDYDNKHHHRDRIAQRIDDNVLSRPAKKR